MIRHLFIASLFFFSSASLTAKHLAGGEVSYEYLGRADDETLARYKVTLKLYRDCETNTDDIEPYVVISIYPFAGGVLYKSLKIFQTRQEFIRLISKDPCIDQAPVICYDIGYYTTEVELPLTVDGYIVAFQRCCRIIDLENVFTSSGEIGLTYTTRIPGTGLVTSGPENSTPIFNTSDTVVVCANNPFVYDFGATDADGDELRFAFIGAFLGATKGGVPIDASSPPYTELDYRFGYSSAQPLGDKVTIDPLTGMISGTAPPEGTYVITVGVAERRNGQVINVHRKDLHLKVADCTIASATLKPAYITCKANGEILLANESYSPKILSYEWDTDTASLADPLITTSAALIQYANPGTYTLRLITNKGQDCADTAYTTIKVFPGFNPAFNLEEACVGLPYRFQDQTTTSLGIVDQWKWDFGDTGTLEDVADTPSATYQYSNKGRYRVSLIVSSTVGCIDTLFRDIDVGDRPEIGLMGDTLICTADTIRLQTKATGTFNWSPNYMISDVNATTPLVSPDVPTTYYVSFYSSPGCFSTDSLFVDVRSYVSLLAGQDTSICLGDSFFIRPQSDGLSFRWSPATTVSSPTAKESWAKPSGTTRYSVVASIGKCQATDGFVVNTVSYPVADAGADTVICIGDAAFLSARGGQKYFWYPGNTLDDQMLRSPVARPFETTDYAVAVYDDLGCPKPSYDTVRVVVIPPVVAFAGNDTVMTIGQPMQLRASGGSVYSWSPVDNLDRPDADDPIARLNDDMTYVVRVSTQEGCYAFDTVKVKVYKTPPELFVPTAFTPNGDGLNDQLKPIPVGIASLVYFKVYNRYGELVFSTDVVGKGWDGVYKGRDQSNESFVWQAMGIDYLGNQVFRKGQTTLIR